MCALELVADRATKAPADKRMTAAVHRATCENCAMVRVSGNNVILSPPLVLSAGNVDTILSALDAGLSQI
jgi:adenosylmethionine-8-amino-7-oxononanoate aminotransferase